MNDRYDLTSTLNEQSCAQFTHDRDRFVITFKLDAVYLVDNLLVLGDRAWMLVGGFEVYIGVNSDYTNN